MILRGIFHQSFGLINCRYFSLKFEPSIISYKQMPDAFYNLKRKNLPLKIFDAVSHAKFLFHDSLIEKLNTFQYKYDISPPALLNRLMLSRLNRIRHCQLIPSEAIDVLGIELCVAHITLHLGGAVRLVGSNEWLGRIKDGSKLLPTVRVKNFKIEAIDLSGTNVTYEGLEYLPSLGSLKELRINSSPFLDDHCLRRIGRMRRKLEYLDISNCPQLTGRGLAALWSLRNLKTLVVANNPLLEDKELVSILLMEKIPQLRIEGVDYLSALDTEQKNRIVKLLEECDKKQEKFSESSSNVNSDDETRIRISE